MDNIPIEEMPEEIDRLLGINEELKDRINKAIEYIEENCGADNRLQLKIILQGSDKNEQHIC